MFVKVCGLGEIGAARMAAESGADAVGFIFYPPSRRYIVPEQAGAIARDLPPSVLRVGVVVDAGLAEIREIAERARLDAIQLHGAEPPEFCAAVRRETGLRVIKARRVRDRESLAGLAGYAAAVDWFLLDTDRPGQPGGTGEAFDWSLARAAREELAVPARGELALSAPVLLAGGLTPENVATALTAAEPDGVDVSSGVETGGCKDLEKIARFIAAVRRWEHDQQNLRLA